VWLLAAVLVPLTVYVLTAPVFAAMIVPDDTPSPEQIEKLRAIYGPLIWLHQHSKLFETFYEWWKHLLGYP